MSDEDQPLRSVEEIAAELGVGSKRVRAAVKKLRGRIGTQPGERNGKRDGRVRLYGAEARAAIRRQVAQDQVRRQLVGEQGVAYWRALASLRIAGRKLGKLTGDLGRAYDALRIHPPSVSATIHTLPHPRLELASPPVVVLVTPLRQSAWRARFAEADLEASGKGQEGALLALRRELVSAYRALRDDPEQDPERWAVLPQLIRERRPTDERNGSEAGEQATAAEEHEQLASLAAAERRDA